jgi:hypothetical protein
MNDAFELDRSKLTFEQAEGVEPLPSQLRLREISQQLRALLWNIIYNELLTSSDEPGMYKGPRFMIHPWRTILLDFHIERKHRMADDFDPKFDAVVAEQKAIFAEGT